MSNTQTYKKKSFTRIALIVFGVILFLAGAAIIYLTLFQEQKATALYGDIKVYTSEIIREAGGTPPGEEPPDPETGLPVITLNGSGGQYELDLCMGDFIHMTGYQDHNNLPPVWSAHNGCGGDIILGWEIGTHFMSGGEEYKIVDFRTAPQIGSTTNDIAGMDGDLILQSCTYDGYTMYFMGAEKVKPEPEPETEASENAVTGDETAETAEQST